jgi:hypothetical protein
MDRIPGECPWRSHGWLELTPILLDSFRDRVGRELIARGATADDEARRLYEAPFIVVAHGTQDDPILSYGNHAALQLWEVDAPTLLRMPSRLTAEPMRREERAQLLQRAARDGYVDDYQGIRISRSGRRFRIEQAIIWNLRDAHGQPAGQAATFSRWHYLDE